MGINVTINRGDYIKALENLGNKLKTKMPQFRWEYDNEAGIWITYDTSARGFLGYPPTYADYRNKWRIFLGIPDLIIFEDLKNLFGFTVD